MDKKLPISLCILSWKSVKTLANSLRSYQKNGLLELVDEVTILFQEVTEEDRKLAEKFNLKCIGLSENRGIGLGIRKLVEETQNENILFLEHDWELIENPAITYHQLESGLDFLNNGYDVVRYRSRRKPGFPLHALNHKGNELNYYDDWHKCTSPHLLESLYWLDPAKEFPDKIQKEGDFFVTTARWANWTNNPFLAKKEFLLNKVLNFAGEKISFERNIAAWWVKQDFKIAQGEGLFMHNDFVKYPPKSLKQKIKEKIKRILKIN